MIALVGCALALRLATPSAVPAKVGRSTQAAPADAYFGPFGMRPLSIRSTIGLLGREYRARTISDHDLLRKPVITEDALHRWRTEFPADPWLAPTFFHLAELYTAVQSAEARKHARSVLAYVVAAYPATKQGHLSRLRLADGFPPLVPESALVATPAPSAAGVAPAAGAASAAGAAPAASATPAP